MMIVLVPMDIIGCQSPESLVGGTAVELETGSLKYSYRDWESKRGQHAAHLNFRSKFTIVIYVQQTISKSGQLEATKEKVFFCCCTIHAAQCSSMLPATLLYHKL